jgi:hypothetical protein
LKAPGGCGVSLGVPLSPRSDNRNVFKHIHATRRGGDGTAVQFSALSA